MFMFPRIYRARQVSWYVGFEQNYNKQQIMALVVFISMIYDHDQGDSNLLFITSYISTYDILQWLIKFGDVPHQ